MIGVFNSYNILALAYRDAGVVVWWCGDADACGGDGGDD